MITYIMIKVLIKCADLRSLPLGFATVACGAAAAALRGNFDFRIFLLCLLFAIGFQILGNFISRYADTDENYEKYIQLTQVKSSVSLKLMLKEASTMIAIFLLMISFVIVAITGPWFFAGFILIAFLLYINNFGPYPLTRTPFSWLFTFLVFGPIGVIGTNYLMAEYRPLDALNLADFSGSILLGINMGLLAGNSLLLYQYVCIDNDRLYGKRTLATLLGKRGTQILFVICSIIPFVFSLTGVNHLDKPTVYLPFAFTILVMGAYLYLALKMPKMKVETYLKYQVACNFIPAILALWYLVVFLIWGAPDLRNIDFF